MASKPTKANLECADVIMNRNRLDPAVWKELRRDIALTVDIAEASARQSAFDAGLEQSVKIIEGFSTNAAMDEAEEAEAQRATNGTMVKVEQPST